MSSLTEAPAVARAQPALALGELPAASTVPRGAIRKTSDGGVSGVACRTAMPAPLEGGNRNANLGIETDCAKLIKKLPFLNQCALKPATARELLKMAASRNSIICHYANQGPTLTAPESP
jgi:hypothetical protein